MKPIMFATVSSPPTRTCMQIFSASKSEMSRPSIWLLTIRLIISSPPDPRRAAITGFIQTFHGFRREVIVERIAERPVLGWVWRKWNQPVSSARGFLWHKRGVIGRSVGFGHHGIAHLAIQRDPVATIVRRLHQGNGRVRDKVSPIGMDVDPLFEWFINIKIDHAIGGNMRGPRNPGIGHFVCRNCHDLDLPIFLVPVALH